MSDDKTIYEAGPKGHWKDLFPKKNMVLGTHHLDDGEEIIAIIDHIEKDIEIKTGRKGDPTALINLIHFDPTKNIMPMALNVGNSKIIAALYGDKYAGWYGHAIQIYSGEVRCPTGGMTQGLCVRSKKPNVGQPIDMYIKQLKACRTMEQLAENWKNIPIYLKDAGTETAEKLNVVKDEMKGQVSA